MTAVRIDLLKQLASGYRFNINRIHEMHGMLRRVDCLRDCPGIDNPLMKSAMQEIREYIVRWEELKDTFPHGIPVVNTFIDIDVKEKQND